MKGMDGLIFLLPYMLSVGIILTVGIYVLTKRSGPASRAFGLMTLLEFAWSFFLLLEIGSPVMETKILLDNFQYMVMFALSVAFFDFAMVHTEVFIRWRWRILSMVSLPVIVFTIFLFSPGREWLYRINPVLRVYFYGTELHYGYGVMAWISIIWALCMVFAGIALLLYRVVRPKNHSRFLALWLAIGFLFPSLLIWLTLVSHRPVGQLRDVTPLLLALSNLMIAPVLFRYRLLDALPEVRSDIMRDLEEAVVVTDTEGYIIDGNRAAESLFNRRFGIFPGKVRLAQYFPRSAPLIGSVGELEEDLPGETPEIYRIHFSPIFRGGHLRGTVAVFHDMTRCRMSERELHNIRLTLERLVRERTKDLEHEVDTRSRAEDQLALLNEDLVNGRKEILLTLGGLLERRSEETARHVLRVAEVAWMISAKMGLDEELCRRIRDAAPLHDVGKVAIPDAILNKPGPLTPSEWEVMRKHAEIGYGILKNSTREPLVTAAVIARSHHERWDGGGYPNKLKGLEIPLEGRIVALADVFDALRCRRMYGDPWSENRIVDYIMAGRGSQFDPEVAEAFGQIVNECFTVMIRFPDPVIPA
jgi:putative nucleotidyltransferase with HDIG domain